MYTLSKHKAKRNGKIRLGSKILTANDGIHKAKNVISREVAINNQVLRVHLDRLDPFSEGKYGSNGTVHGEYGRKISLNRRSQRSRRISVVAQRKINSLDEITSIFGNISATSLRKYQSDIINNNSQKPTSTSRMMRNKSETPNRSSVQVVRNIASSPSRVVKYRTSSNELLNKSDNSKYVVSKHVTSTPYMNHNLNPKIKNTYQVRRKPGVDTVRYCLEYLPKKPFEDRILNYKFSKLSVDVRSLRLPAPHWKIKIYMRNKVISSIAFTNKQEHERALKFSATNNTYEMIIDNKKAELLGSPLTVDGRQDVEILLDILHNISSDNPMIIYKQST